MLVIEIMKNECIFSLKDIYNRMEFFLGSHFSHSKIIFANWRWKENCIIEMIIMYIDSGHFQPRHQMCHLYEVGDTNLILSFSMYCNRPNESGTME